MSEPVKLTKAQYFLLIEISDSEQTVGPFYKPAKKLASLGFAEWAGRTLKITPAGRKHIEDMA